MKKINLSKGNRWNKIQSDKFTLIDNNDFDRINKSRWHIANGYAEAWINGQKIYLHRFLTTCPKEKEVDHINGNKLDNRRENLRICTHSENMHNNFKLITNKSGFKGVSWNKKYNKWESRIFFKNKQLFIGFFKNKLHATMAYDLWAKELYKDFAQLNFKSL